MPCSMMFILAGVKPQHKVALLFDCDGVIVDTEQLHRRCVSSVCAWMFVTHKTQPRLNDWMHLY